MKGKKNSEFRAGVFAEKLCTLAGRASAHERRGSPLMPALSGQAQTEKVTVCGVENKCFLASCRAEREREREREKAGYFMLMVVPPLDPHTQKKRTSSLSLNIFQNRVKFIRTSIHLQKLNSPKLTADIGYNDYWVSKNDFCHFS